MVMGARLSWSVLSKVVEVRVFFPASEFSLSSCPQATLLLFSFIRSPSEAPHYNFPYTLTRGCHEQLFVRVLQRHRVCTGLCILCRRCVCECRFSSMEFRGGCHESHLYLYGLVPNPFPDHNWAPELSVPTQPNVYIRLSIKHIRFGLDKV